ncbi:MAG: hypothetical protein H6Q91_390, partial [Deltaproteobacteria bacterium]|nr:hypothetical protein [Deltaproteobacteria bacterium]
ELDLMRRNFGQITLAAATANDVVGWILLGAVAGAARSGDFTLSPVLVHFAAVGAFMVIAFAIGQRSVDAILRVVLRRAAGVAGAVSVTLLLALAFGAVAQLFEVEAVLGAFVAGILCGRSRYQTTETFARIETLTSSFFAPLFFTTAGLRADLGALADPTALKWGPFAGAMVARLHAFEGFALGAALNARGAVELIVAAVGLGAGVLNAASYTIVVLIALSTSMMAPPLLRIAARRWQGSEEEQTRLSQERLHGSNLLVRPGRVLLPTRGGPNSVLAARVLDLAWPEGTKVTVMTAGEDGPPADLRRLMRLIEKKPVEHVHSGAADPLPAIVEQAGLGYNAIVVGATDRLTDGRAHSSFVDRLLAASPVPVIMIRRGVEMDQSESETPDFRRVLVPAIASLPGRAAQEVAFGIAKRLGAEALLAHVVTAPSPQDEMHFSRFEWRPDDSPEAEGEAPWMVARQVVDDALALAREMDVRSETAIRIGISVPREILALSREAGADLIVLPASLRQLSERPFLGYGVEYLLRNSESTIVVVSLPGGWRGHV